MRVYELGDTDLGCVYKSGNTASAREGVCSRGWHHCPGVVGSAGNIAWVV